MNWDIKSEDQLTRKVLQQELENLLPTLTKKMITRAVLKEELNNLLEKTLTSTLTSKLDEMKEEVQKQIKELASMPTPQFNPEWRRSLSANDEDAPKKYIGKRGFGSSRRRKTAKPEVLPKFFSFGSEDDVLENIDADTAEAEETLDLMASRRKNSDVPLLTPQQCDPRGFGPHFDRPHQPMCYDDKEREIRLAFFEKRQQALDSKPHKDTPLQATLRSILEGPHFEPFIGILVMLNALEIGLDTNFQAINRGEESPQMFSICESLFCALFCIELALRIFVFRTKFWCGDGWELNLFDTLLVGLQVVDQTVQALSSLNLHLNVTGMRFLRVLRLIRITRAIRVFKLFNKLKDFVSSMASFSLSLLWASLIIVLAMCIVGIFFLQMILNSDLESKFPEVEHYFPDVTRTVLTLLECVVGGLSWDRVLHPLVENSSPWTAMTFVFCFFASMFVMMNCVIAVLVEKFTTSVREDKDYELSNRLWDLFSDDQEEITWEEFKSQLGTPVMRDLFMTIDVDPTEAKALFALLDSDGSGTLDTEEMIHSFLKMRGPAKALEVTMLMRWVYDMQQQMIEHFIFVECRLEVLCEKMGADMQNLEEKLQTPTWRRTVNFDSEEATALRTRAKSISRSARPSVISNAPPRPSSASLPSSPPSSPRRPELRQITA